MGVCVGETMTQELEIYHQSDEFALGLICSLPPLTKIPIITPSNYGLTAIFILPAAQGVMFIESNGYIRIGRGTARAAIGDYAEALIFSSVDSTVIEKMEGYLMHKWGLAANLPSSHTYKSSAPASIAWSDVQSFTTSKYHRPTSWYSINR